MRTSCEQVDISCTLLLIINFHFVNGQLCGSTPVLGHLVYYWGELGRFWAWVILTGFDYFAKLW